jgi:hypothetical protein
MEDKFTLVLVASLKEERYSNKAVRMLMEHNVPVAAIGRREGKIENLELLVGTPNIQGLDTITLYLNPTNQQSYYSYIIALKPRRVLFNPGTENAVFQLLLNENGIEWEEACTLVLLSTNQY